MIKVTKLLTGRAKTQPLFFFVFFFIALYQGSANLFCKETENKSLGFASHNDHLCHNYLIVLV